MIRCEKRARSRKKGVATYMLRIIINCACATYHIQMWDWDKDRDCLLHSQDCFLRNMQGLLRATSFILFFI